MDKAKFAMQEIQTLAVDLNGIVDEWKRSEERRVLLEFEWGKREKERKEKGSALPAVGIGRPVPSFDSELVLIRNRLNLVIMYLTGDGALGPNL